MDLFFSMLVPCLLLLVSLYATAKGVDVYTALLTGAKDGLEVMSRVLPALITLLTGISMLRASGALDAFSLFLSPMVSLFGIPPEVVPLMLIRPFSGSGALGVGAELLETYGADSFIGQVTSVMLGSTETTFYTIAVYFGACGINKTRYAVPAALAADCTGFLMATITVSLFLT